MNILILSQFFSVTRGGGEYVFSLIAKKLAENNHKVWIITNKIIGENYVSHKNIQIILVPPTLQYKGGLPPGFLDNLRYSVNAIKAGLKIIKKEKIEIIHSNNFAPALSGAILSSLTSKPHVTTIHDVFSLCGKNYWKMWGEQQAVSKINVMLAPFFEKLMTKLTHICVHTVSNASRDDLIRFGEKKPIYVIHNSIDTLQVHGLETNQLQFVYVGRLVFYKNLEVVIKAINLLRREESRIKLIIVGDGPHKKTLKELTKNLHLESHIEFKGHVPEDEKIKLISSSNALVQPSLCEGFGLVILEAFGQNRPVLVSNVRPMSDIVSHERTGFVLDPHDEKVWASHLLKLIKNPKLALMMGENGNRELVSQYSQDSMYQKLLKMYKIILKNDSNA